MCEWSGGFMECCDASSCLVPLLPQESEIVNINISSTAEKFINIFMPLHYRQRARDIIRRQQRGENSDCTSQ